MNDFVTKDSGAREQFDSGMQRDTEAGKPRFDLMIPEGVPYEEQMLTRFAMLLSRGAEKYDARNWEQASGQEEIERAKSSAFRHFFQWICGERDEDHAAAVIFNLMVVETTERKIALEELGEASAAIAGNLDRPSEVVPDGELPPDRGILTHFTVHRDGTVGQNIQPFGDPDVIREALQESIDRRDSIPVEDLRFDG